MKDVIIKANYVRGSNFGDCIFPYMLKKMGYRHEWTHHTEEYKIISTGSIMGVGSKPNTIVWGSGIISENVSVDKDAIFVLVRGKYSAKAIHQDVPLGDPALALSKFYKPEAKEVLHEIGIIPHQIHFDKVVREMKDKNLNYNIIDPSTGYKEQSFQNYIDQIVSCEKIVSTSLHGVITAHAYGVPAIALYYDESLIGDGTKFLDYYSVWEEYENAELDQVLIKMPLESVASSDRFWTPSVDRINKRSTIIMGCCPLTHHDIDEKFTIPGVTE